MIDTKPIFITAYILIVHLVCIYLTVIQSGDFGYSRDCAYYGDCLNYKAEPMSSVDQQITKWFKDNNASQFKEEFSSLQVSVDKFSFGFNDIVWKHVVKGNEPYHITNTDFNEFLLDFEDLDDLINTGKKGCVYIFKGNGRCLAHEAKQYDKYKWLNYYEEEKDYEYLKQWTEELDELLAEAGYKDEGADDDTRDETYALFKCLRGIFTKYMSSCILYIYIYI